MKKKISRRQMLKGTATLAAATAAGCTTLNSKNERDIASVDDDRFEFVIVGSGAGGGPLAARLAQAGFRVLLLEAGTKETSINSQVPAFHAKATDDARINWSFFVRRYTDIKIEQANRKWVSKKQGVYYPRGSALGGSTAMNAMICLYPESRDWSKIEALTGDRSWNPYTMFEHFERLQTSLPDKNKFFQDLIRQQFEKGWLEINQNSLALLLQDWDLLQIVWAALNQEGVGIEAFKKTVGEGFNLKLNPNTQASSMQAMDGLYNLPVSIKNGVRRGVREFLLETAQKYPNLVIRTECLVKNLIFSDTEKNKIVGVEYAEGAKLYSAHQEYQASQTYSVKKAFAAKEVILCGGAFNTPQLLQLSGIGDESFLKQMGIEPRVHLPGVGLNLQDRYEVGVVTQFPRAFNLVKNCTFGEAGDPCFDDYRRNAGHVYGTNGAAAAILNRSGKNYPNGYAIFGLPGNFRGYYPEWSKDAYDPTKFTWVILKGHTQNRSGYVRIRSTDFRDTPEINFRSFNDGTDWNGNDMEDMVDAIEYVRKIMDRLPRETMSGSEVWPGNGRQARSELKQFVRNESWGHHASCSCPMGALNDEKAVVDSEFKVRKVSGLRIVDASIFPEIPGLFIAVPILTVSEKAAQLLIQKYRK